MHNINDIELPEKLTLLNFEINSELRKLLNDVFDILARDNGIALDDIRETAILEALSHLLSLQAGVLLIDDAHRHL